MASRTSAGLLMFRRRPAGPEVFLVHPGGPYWRGRDAGAWTIPKGGVEPGESLLEAARREFTEETGVAPAPPYLPLGRIRQRGGKIVHAWAFEGDCDPDRIVSSKATIEWPPRSGRTIDVPEIDRAAFYRVDRARVAINPAQVALLDRLIAGL
jgi:predicted NUDIX family NTP pyrophosphohydrolase